MCKDDPGPKVNYFDFWGSFPSPPFSKLQQRELTLFSTQKKMQNKKNDSFSFGTRLWGGEEGKKPAQKTTG